MTLPIWTLNIEALGPIRSASVEIAPMLLFCGENNSGKSYLLTLLWGIVGLAEDLFPKEEPNTPRYKRCEKWLQERVLSCPTDPAPLDATDLEVLQDWLNERLAASKDGLMRKLFRSDITLGAMSLTGLRAPPNFECQIAELVRHLGGGGAEGRPCDAPIVGLTAHDHYFLLVGICMRLLVGDLNGEAGSEPGLRIMRSDPLYLPASRTGFMLTYKTLLQGFLAERLEGAPFEGANVDSPFSLPTARFLQALVSIRLRGTGGEKLGNKRSPQVAPDLEKSPLALNANSDVAKFLMAEVVKGEIFQDDAPVPNYLFQPAKTRAPIPLRMASSLVTELAPFVLFLNSGRRYNPYMIEEPEAHLHLDMQRKMAQTLARLVHQRTCVWITTHSDTILQQLNILIQLSGKSSAIQQQFGYLPQEVLLPSDVGAYQLNIESDGSSSIHRLSVDSNGIAAATFNESIARMSREVIELLDEVQDES